MLKAYINGGGEGRHSWKRPAEANSLKGLKRPGLADKNVSPFSGWMIMDRSYNAPDSSVHGILQARILERVAMPSSRGSS